MGLPVIKHLYVLNSTTGYLVRNFPSMTLLEPAKYRAAALAEVMNKAQPEIATA